MLAEGLDCIVFNAADIPTSDRDAEFNTNAREAAKIARSLCSGELRGIHLPMKQLQADHALARLQGTTINE